MCKEKENSQFSGSVLLRAWNTRRDFQNLQGAYNPVGKMLKIKTVCCTVASPTLEARQNGSCVSFPREMVWAESELYLLLTDAPGSKGHEKLTAAARQQPVSEQPASPIQQRGCRASARPEPHHGCSHLSGCQPVPAQP